MASDPILIIDRGDFPSLATCAIQPNPDRIILFHLVEPDAASGRRRDAVQLHAEAWSVRRLIVTRAIDLGMPGMAPPQSIFESCLLLQAVAAARQCGCRRIVWPLRLGPDETLVPMAVDRASAVSELANMDDSGASIEIDLPVVDLTAEQIVELAEDVGAPLRAFWPCRMNAGEPCGKCAGCVQWATAFQANRFTWPWLTPEIVITPDRAHVPPRL